MTMRTPLTSPSLKRVLRLENVRRFRRAGTSRPRRNLVDGPWLTKLTLLKLIKTSAMTRRTLPLNVFKKKATLVNIVALKVMVLLIRRALLRCTKMTRPILINRLVVIK